MKRMRMAGMTHVRAVDAHEDRVAERVAFETTVAPDQPPPLRFLRFAAVHERTGLSRSTIWRLERRGQFPKHRLISANAVAWVEQELVDWIRTRMEVAV